MPWVAWVMTLLLLVLHQDWWLWNDSTLLFGFLPVGLGWHVAISLVAALWWGIVVYRFWPSELDEPTTPDQRTGASPSTLPHTAEKPAANRPGANRGGRS